MEPAERAYDAIFTSRLGRDATYDGPDSDGEDCRVLWYDPEAKRASPGFGLGGAGGFGVAERPLWLLVRRSEIERPETGGAFVLTVGGQTWRIGEDAPIGHDPDGYVWRCRVVRET